MKALYTRSALLMADLTDTLVALSMTATESKPKRSWIVSPSCCWSNRRYLQKPGSMALPGGDPLYALRAPSL